MERKKYATPCFECIWLWSGEIMTTDILGGSIDNDWSWSDSMRNPASTQKENIIF